MISCKLAHDIRGGVVRYPLAYVTRQGIGQGLPPLLLLLVRLPLLLLLLSLLHLRLLLPLRLLLLPLLLLLCLLLLLLLESSIPARSERVGFSKPSRTNCTNTSVQANKRAGLSKLHHKKLHKYVFFRNSCSQQAYMI